MTDEMADELIARAEELIREKKNQKAVEAADELSEVDPKDAVVWYIKGKANYLAEQYEEALAALSRAASIQQERPEIWHLMGYSLIALRRYDEAIAPLEYVRAVQPQNVQAICALAIVSIILQREEAAGAYLNEARSIDAAAADAMIKDFNSKFFEKSPAVNPQVRLALSTLLK